MDNQGGSRILQMFGVSEDSPAWNDWQWQYNNRIEDTERLCSILALGDTEKKNIESCLGLFRMAITPYYASLIRPDDPFDPIRMQAVPSVHETEIIPFDMPDPLDEERKSPVKNIVHTYPDRVLFLVTRRCAMYCRHCTRRRLVGEEDFSIRDQEIENALNYIRQTPVIRDVLISGGDPFVLSDERLDYILTKLREISHVEILRIGTRTPVTLPMRITPTLLAMLRKHQPLWINTHFNHPNELTEAAVASCGRIADAGIPLGNQSVLLRGINDNVAVMKELLLKLVKSRVRPYYLYQCDLSEGLHHFRTDVRTGIGIIQQLTGSISGFALPTFVIDAPKGGGKIPIHPETVLSIDDQTVIMTNYRGERCEYPQPDKN